MNLDLLPEDCIAHIISFSSPKDACRISVVSSVIRSAADSNAVWERFLPSNYKEILSRFVSPMEYSSKKDLFFMLCSSSILMDGGNKTFSLDKLTGKIRYMLSARELSITYGNDPMYWTWKPLSESRFEEVAELRSTWWLEIQGKIDSRMLSAHTRYSAYLIVKFAERAFGLSTLPSEVSIEVGRLKSQGTVKLGGNSRYKHSVENVFMLAPIQVLVSRAVHGEDAREDGWAEVELGSFYNDGCEQEVKMSIREVKGTHLKGGLIVEGIELRPKVGY